MACKPLPPIGGTGGKDEMEKDVCGEEEEDEEKVGGHERDETRMEYSATDSSDEEVGGSQMASLFRSYIIVIS